MDINVFFYLLLFMPSLYSHHYCYIYSFLHSLLSPDTLGCFYCHRAGSRYSGVVVSKPLEGGLGVLPQWGYRGQLPCWKAQGAKPPGKITILSNSNLKFRLSWLKKPNISRSCLTILLRQFQQLMINTEKETQFQGTFILCTKLAYYQSIFSSMRRCRGRRAIFVLYLLAKVSMAALRSTGYF